MPFLIIFIVIPLMELAVFASVSEHIGIGTTLLLAFVTAIIGGTLVKRQGMQTISNMRGSMDRGEMPVGEIFDGFCLVAAGALLITPGFITDFVGFALLVPYLRGMVKKYFKNHTNFTMAGAPNMGGGQARHPRDPSVLDGEYERVDEDDVQIEDKGRT